MKKVIWIVIDLNDQSSKSGGAKLGASKGAPEFGEQKGAGAKISGSGSFQFLKLKIFSKIRKEHETEFGI